MQPSPDQAEIVLIMRLVGAIHRVQENTMDRYTQQEWGLTAGQMRLLLCLTGDGATRTLELAHRLFTDPGTVSGLLRRLARKGLVATEHSPSDRRVQLVSLTPTGRQVRSEFFTRWDSDPQWLQMVSALSGPSRDALRQVLVRHAEALLGAEDSARLMQRLQLSAN